MVLFDQGNIHPDVQVRYKWCIQRNQSQIQFIVCSEVGEFLFEDDFIIK